MNSIFFLCIVALAVSTTQASTCAEKLSFQQMYAKASVVVLGDVVDVKKNQSHIVYKVRVVSVRSDKKQLIQSGSSINITTPSRKSSCGVTNLKMGQLYYLSADFEDEMFSMKTGRNFHFSRLESGRTAVEIKTDKIDKCKVTVQSVFFDLNQCEKCPLNQVYSTCKVCNRPCGNKFDACVKLGCRSGCQCPQSAPFSHPNSGKCITEEECTNLNSPKAIIFPN